ncbi:MAG: hypothetical protein EOP06_23295 [Proteobacteria bacterium]|nr:MAG: hypothetical protein EOP06_23295 [Pseudomonadota bacterium]
MRRNKKFEALFGKYPSYDYYNWVLGIQNGGYAASKLWGTHVLDIIRKYKLYEFDKRPEGTSELNFAAAPVLAINSENFYFCSDWFWFSGYIEFSGTIEIERQLDLRFGQLSETVIFHVEGAVGEVSVQILRYQ